MIRTPGAAFRNTASLIAKGFGMGAADVVPGVSGGTMAVVLGIYRRLLLAVRSFDLPALGLLARGRVMAAFQRPDWVFLIPLLIGIGGALGFFTRIVPLPTLLKTHPEPVYGLFFGLIVGTIVQLLQTDRPRDAGDVTLLVLGALGAWVVVNLVPLNIPSTGVFLFLAGFIALSAMLLPGISGGFLLLVLNQYDTVLQAIGYLHWGRLIPFVLGGIAGLMVFSRVFSWLLARYYRHTLMFIIGVLVGSLWRIWPFQTRRYAEVGGEEKLVASQPVWPQALDGDTLLALTLAALGFGLVFALHWLAHRRPRETSHPAAD
jgi:putative membrane protein